MLFFYFFFAPGAVKSFTIMTAARKSGGALAGESHSHDARLWLFQLLRSDYHDNRNDSYPSPTFETTPANHIKHSIVPSRSIT
eukprot:3969667-Amphidinium_carterae.1